jgi:TrwC relaxase
LPAIPIITCIILSRTSWLRTTRVGSIDSKALSPHKVHEYGAFSQARLADRLRTLGIRVGLDAEQEALVALDIPESAVATFSKRDRQVIGDAKRYAKEQAMSGTSSRSSARSISSTKPASPVVSARPRMRRNRFGEAKRRRSEGTPKSVLDATAPIERTAGARHERAYTWASESLSAEFLTSAVLDVERLRVHAARGLIEAGATGGREDVDAVAKLFEERSFVHDGKSVTLIFGVHEGKARLSHTEQLRIEQTVADKSRRRLRPIG